MITIVEVIRAISETVEALFGAPPVTKDLKEGFSRPCTKLSLLDTQVTREGKLRHETAELELTRFAARTDRGWIDLLHAQAALTEALEKPIRVDEQFHLVTEDVDVDPVREDMALYCTFSVEWFQDTDATPAEGSTDPMLQLDINGERAAEPED